MIRYFLIVRRHDALSVSGARDSAPNSGVRVEKKVRERTKQASWRSTRKN